MGKYLFRRCDNDESVELEMGFDELMVRMDNRRHLVLEDGTEVYRDVQGELRRDGCGRKRKRKQRGRWPIESWSLGVRPEDAQELRDELKRHGLGHVEVNAEGNPILTGPRMKREVSRALGQRPLDEYTA